MAPNMPTKSLAFTSYSWMLLFLLYWRDTYGPWPLILLAKIREILTCEQRVMAGATEGNVSLRMKMFWIRSFCIAHRISDFLKWIKCPWHIVDMFFLCDISGAKRYSKYLGHRCTVYPASPGSIILAEGHLLYSGLVTRGVRLASTSQVIITSHASSGKVDQDILVRQAWQWPKVIGASLMILRCWWGFLTWPVTWGRLISLTSGPHPHKTAV